MDLPLGLTHASALSAVFNNEPQSNSGHCQNSNQENRVICSLCPIAVLLNDAASSSQGNFMERSRMLKNLCHHMQISSANISSECSTKTHPLCKNCEDRMIILWKLQGVLDTVGLEISKIVKTIEQSVLEDHVINWGLQQSAFKRVTILKDKIKEGYLNKLLMTRNNPPVVSRANKVEVNQEADVVIHGPSTPSSSRRTGDVGVEAEGQGRRETIATASSPERVQIKRETVGNQLVEAEEEDDVENYFVGNLLAVDPQQEGMGSVGFTQVNQGGSMVLVEQEEQDVTDYNEEERNQDQQVVAPDNGFGTGSPLQEEGQLQCNLCNHTIIILNKSMSAHKVSVSQMRMHIRSAHKNERQRQPKRLNFTCSHCTVTFDTKESLTEHENAQHIIHCEICKRPFLPHQKNYLPKHLFSHKNHAEKKAACKAREPGAPKGRDLRVPRILRILTCSICQRTFSSKGCSFRMHMKSAHKNRMETCSFAAAEAQQHDLIVLPRGLE